MLTRSLPCADLASMLDARTAIFSAARPEASAIMNLVRSLASSIGVALMQALTVFNTQAMHAAMVARITRMRRA